MPELPEVETVRRVLKDDLIKLTITDIEVRYKNIIENDLDYFINNVKNKKIVDINRFAKFLIFKLDKGNFISHLRMEGKYFYLNDDYDNKHVHVIFHLSNGYRLLYQDVRKFGRMEYKEDDELYTTEPLSKVGYDPILDNDFNLDKIYQKINNKNIPIKSTLLDQSIIAGLGNIYVDEVLYMCGINPHRKSNEITKDETKALVDASRSIFVEAIKNKGTTIRSYTSSLGVEGSFQDHLLVHTKEICPHCQAKLNKDKIDGRSTYYCNLCQK